MKELPRAREVLRKRADEIVNFFFMAASVANGLISINDEDWREH
jgi:hypothetical protein